MATIAEIIVWLKQPIERKLISQILRVFSFFRQQSQRETPKSSFVLQVQ